MAIFNSILFHRARKSVGNVTLYALNEQNVVRAKGFHRRDRKSLAQLKQRARMKAVREVGSHFYHVLSQGFCCSSLKEGLNCFVKANVGKIFVDDELKVSYDLLKLEISGGMLMPPVLSAELEVGENRVIFRWERQRLMPYAFGDDQLYGVVSKIGDRDGEVIPLGCRGISGELSWELPEGWNIHEVAVHGFAMNSKGNRASVSVGLVMGGSCCACLF